VDGNKRTPFMTMVVFLRKNDVRFAPVPGRCHRHYDFARGGRK